MLIELSGELDLAARDQLRDRLLSAAVSETVVEVDCANVTFLDSTAIGALIAAKKRSVELGHTFGIVNASERVLRVLRITGLEDVLLSRNT